MRGDGCSTAPSWSPPFDTNSAMPPAACLAFCILRRMPLHINAEKEEAKETRQPVPPAVLALLVRRRPFAPLGRAPVLTTTLVGTFRRPITRPSASQAA